VIEPDRGIKNTVLKSWIPFSLGGSYRYFTGSLAYVLHRVTGLALIFYLFFHIHSITEANQADPSAYDLMIRRFQEPDFKLGELLLYAALLFHGINGMRILLVDFVINGTRWHKKLFWGFAVLIVALLVVGAVPLIWHWNVQPLLQPHGIPGSAGGH
jgi:succinate dehydrogenase / fumarate reductase, cytochrome b subunit